MEQFHRTLCSYIVIQDNFNYRVGRIVLNTDSRFWGGNGKNTSTHLDVWINSVTKKLVADVRSALNIMIEIDLSKPVRFLLCANVNQRRDHFKCRVHSQSP